jgi:CheY-like chemotaxis protein
MKRILNVEDDPRVQKLVKLILSFKDYQVLSANDGLEALAIFVKEKNNLDLILTDLMMPNMDGIALATMIRKNYCNMEIPIIGVTGMTRRLTVEEYKYFNEILVKPYRPSQLRAIVDMYI